jgi:hypothetical protein
MLAEKESKKLLIYIVMAIICLFVPDLLYAKATGVCVLNGGLRVAGWFVTYFGFYCCLVIGGLAEKRMQ